MSRIRVRTWLLLFALSCLYLVQCAWFVRTQSLTYDEPVDIAGGLDAWRHHRFEMYNDHPPLARLLCTLPLLDGKWQIEVQKLTRGWQATRIEPGAEAMARRARSVNVILGAILGVLLWLATGRMFSQGAANWALAFYAFSPAIIAIFSVATTDGTAALMIFAAALTLTRWREGPSLARTALLGVVLGLMLIAKFSAPVMFVLTLGWVLVLKPYGIAVDPRRWNWKKTLVVAIVALIVVWAGYFFHVSQVIVRNNELTTTFPNRPNVVYKPFRSRFNFSLIVPAGEYLEGLRTVVRHNRQGMQGFLLGGVKRAGGWKLYYPVVVLLKWPTVILVLFLCAAVLALRGKLHLPRDLLVMMSFPAVYFGFAIFSRFDLGERQILPMYPFVLLLIGGLWETFRARRTAPAVAILLVVLNAADALRYAPDYLSYFNIFVRPGEAYKLLTDSNLDWGQGLLAVRDYERSHPEENISLAYFGAVDPRLYGVRARLLAEGERATGIVIVSATRLSGQVLDNPLSDRWVLQYPRIAILNHSLYVFQVSGIQGQYHGSEPGAMARSRGLLHGCDDDNASRTHHSDANPPLAVGGSLSAVSCLCPAMRLVHKLSVADLR